MAGKEIKVFVYGTLKVGGPLGRSVKQFLKEVKEATTRGAMYSVHGSYPAVRFDEEGEIKGEVHTYEKPDYVLQTLDTIEGFIGEGNPHNLYNRKVIVIEDMEGVEHECYTYEFANKQAVETFKRVEDGIWRFEK